MFNCDDLHNSIREILGEDLALKFVAEAHRDIEIEKRSHNGSRNNKSRST